MTTPCPNCARPAAFVDVMGIKVIGCMCATNRGITFSQPDFVTRSALRHGQMFTVRQLPEYVCGHPLWRWPRDVLVVLDECTEVGFWQGGQYAVGDVGPGLFVEVIS